MRIEPISGTKHPKILLTSRMLTFMESIKNCSKGSVRYLANVVLDDRRTRVGQSVSKIAKDCDTCRGSLTSRNVTSLEYFRIPEENKWKIPILAELIGARNGHAVIPEVDLDKIIFMLNEICTE